MRFDTRVLHHDITKWPNAQANSETYHPIAPDSTTPRRSALLKARRAMTQKTFVTDLEATLDGQIAALWAARNAAERREAEKEAAKEASSKAAPDAPPPPAPYPAVPPVSRGTPRGGVLHDEPPAVPSQQSYGAAAQPDGALPTTPAPRAQARRAPAPRIVGAVAVGIGLLLVVGIAAANLPFLQSPTGAFPGGLSATVLWMTLAIALVVGATGIWWQRAALARTSAAQVVVPVPTDAASLRALDERITRLMQIRTWIEQDKSLMDMVDDVIGKQVRNATRQQMLFSTMIGVASLIVGWLLSAISPVQLFH